MKITFYSNFLNHHQIPFSNAMYALIGTNYTFVATEPMKRERISMGWGVAQTYPYELRSYHDSQSLQKAILLGEESDVVIIGSAPSLFIHKRLKQNKLIFRYSERIFKQGLWQACSPRWLASSLYFHTRHLKKNMYMLCASAYAAYDFAIIGSYIGKTYQWGYFPEFKEYDVNELLKRKEQQVIKLLWVGRFLKLKHPEDALIVAKRLKDDGFKFSLDIIGTGEREVYLRKLVDQYHLMNYVSFLGVMSPEKVRENMERANIYLLTSDYQEGWGVVLNESMNSGCAVVASHAIGSVPFLIQHGKNGFVYKNGDIDNLYGYIKMLMQYKSLREMFGINAYQTLEKCWNAKVAAQRIIELSEKLLKNGKCHLFADGPCSRARVIAQGKMYCHLTK